MKVMVIGGGGREHAIVKKLKENRKITELYCLPGNGGIAKDAVCVPVAATDLEGIVRFAGEKGIDYAVVTPDDPLALGAVDLLEAAGVPCFGPRKNAAIIEASKVFSKELMKRHGIPTARYERFDKADDALHYLKSASLPIVIKADGLALGKGVIIAQTSEEAEGAVRAMMEDKRFGKSGERIVIEEFLGTVAPNPYYTPEIADRCMREIFLPTIRAMAEEGRPFSGCLYFGLMLTVDGPKVIEYNCRFGDPETQVVLPLLKTDLFTVMQAVTEGTLADCPVEFEDGAAACVILASEGYPGAYGKGYPIDIPDCLDAEVYVAGAKEKDGGLVTSGGRVLGVTAKAPTLGEALKKAYAAAEQIHFENVYYRRDIGKRALATLED